MTEQHHAAPSNDKHDNKSPPTDEKRLGTAPSGSKNGSQTSAPSCGKYRNTLRIGRGIYLSPGHQPHVGHYGRLWVSSAPSTRICYHGDRNLAGEALRVDGRMMERAGFTRTLTSQDTRTWFVDDRNTTQRQADYLTRLRHLRSELIHQEHNNLSNALGRLNNQVQQKEKPRTRSLRKNPLMESGPDSFPSRHMRLMQEKRQRILQYRSRKASPKLETVEGKQLVDPAMKDDSDSTVSKSRSEGEDSVSRDLLKRLHREKDITPVFRKLIQPTHSIPNIGTRALKREQDPDVESKIDSSACVKSLNIPRRYDSIQKDYKLKGMLDGARDEMVVNPATLQYLNYHYDERHGGYEVPASSPVEGLSPEDSDVTLNGTQETPFRLEKIHIDDVPAMQISHKRSNNRVKVQDNTGSHSVRTGNDETPRFPEINGQKLKHPVPEKETDFRLEGNHKKQIVVEMPNIMFRPSTPEPSIVVTDDYAKKRCGPLTKALTQNKIREREIKNLLQDVKDLNQITEQLEERAKIVEADR